MTVHQQPIKNAMCPRGSSDIQIENPCGIPRKKSKSLMHDKKRGRPAGVPRTQQEIDNQKASIKRSQEKRTWLAGGFKRLR